MKIFRTKTWNVKASFLARRLSHIFCVLANGKKKLSGIVLDAFILFFFSFQDCLASCTRYAYI